MDSSERFGKSKSKTLPQTCLAVLGFAGKRKRRNEKNEKNEKKYSMDGVGGSNCACGRRNCICTGELNKRSHRCAGSHNHNTGECGEGCRDV